MPSGANKHADRTTHYRILCFVASENGSLLAHIGSWSGQTNWGLTYGCYANVVLLLPLLINLAWSGPSASVLVGFEPRALTITGSDDTLDAYGFAPVRTPFIPTWGLRGRVDQESGWTTTMAMSYGIAVRRQDGNPVPTTTNQVLVGFGPGHRLGSRGHIGAVVGFASLGHTIGSPVQGGALTYLGPYVEPRGSFRIVDGPSVIELSAAVLTHLPVGRPHSQSLWEDDFRRRVVGGLSVSIHMGPAVGP